MPDIDIDFDDRRRGEMVRYATEKWARTKSPRSSPSAPLTKAALKDSARVQFGQPRVRDRRPDHQRRSPPPIMARTSVHGITDPDHERYGEAAEVRALETDPDVKRIYDTALGLEGLIRNAGVHACAVIMSNEPLTDAIPVWKRAQDGAIITGWDHPSCEAIGLLKMDFWGCAT